MTEMGNLLKVILDVTDFSDCRANRKYPIPCGYIGLWNIKLNLRVTRQKMHFSTQRYPISHPDVLMLIFLYSNKNQSRLILPLEYLLPYQNNLTYITIKS